MKSTIVFEPCERRRLMSAAIVGTTLQIGGTAGDDHISVEIDKSDVSKLRVRVNKTQSLFKASAVKLIRIEGRRGNDDIEIDQTNGAITRKTLIFGGAGDDRIVGGAGRDRLHGDEGDDSILGQSNKDILYGEAGDDSLQGAAG